MTTEVMGTVIYFVALIAIFYFLLIRPQQKARKERAAMMSALAVGDKIFTVGGFIGTITAMDDTKVTFKVADGVEVELLRTGIGGLQLED